MNCKPYSRIITYDFESDGQWSPLNQPIEVYMLLADHRCRNTGAFHSFIKAPHRLNSLVLELTGITDEILEAEGREIKEVFQDISLILKEKQKTLLVGYGIRNFDNRFLNFYLMKFGLPQWNEEHCWDVYARFRADLFGLHQHDGESNAAFEKRCLNHRHAGHVPLKLKDACEHYGIQHNGKFHRAQDDVEKVWEIFKCQYERTKSIAA